jgi:hypothetical protein
MNRTEDRTRSPGAWVPRPAGAPPLQLTDFDPPNAELRMQFPCVADATTTRGLAALCRELPECWEAALARGRASVPRPTPETLLHEVLERGSKRILPRGPSDVKGVSARRSALGRLRDYLPPVRLGDIDPRRMDRLVRQYRTLRREGSSAVLSSDLTELRFTVNAALVEAGLHAIHSLGRAAQPRKRQGRAADRRASDLGEADRMLKGTEGWLRAVVLLRIVTTAPDSALLNLCRGDFDLEAGRLRIDTFATRRPGQPEGHLLFGLPSWCIDQLRACLPGIDAWMPERLLFPASGGKRARRDVSHAIRRAGDGCGCLYTTMRSLRRLAQAVHVRAPRAVRRATAAARGDLAHTVETGEDGRVAAAQEAYAAWVVEHWTHLHAPPAPLARVPRRATGGTAPEVPEQHARTTTDPRSSSLVPSCRPETASTARLAGLTQSRPVTERGPTPPGPNAPPTGPPGVDLMFGATMQLGASNRMAEQQAERALRAERTLAELKARTVTHEDAAALMAFAASGAFVAGMSFEGWLASRPEVRERLGEGVGRVALALAEAMVVGTG